MGLKLIIFSDQLPHRFFCHTLFWFVWFVFLFANWSGLWALDSIIEVIQYDLLSTINRILPQMVFCYFIIYFLIPRFFRLRQFGLGIGLLLFSFIAFSVLQYIALVLIDPFKIMGLEWNARFYHNPSEYKIFYMGHFLYHSGPIVCCAVMGSIRFLKFWYVKQQENVALKRENAVAELQLLKAQVHPHFLFNTLNNIYSFSLSKSPVAGDLIEKLSGILHHMILEGQKTLVPLTKEIQLIQDYISLEKVRYGERLDIAVNISGNCDNKFIAPLLLIPFIENSFKHGSSKMLKDPKVKLSVTIENDELLFDLCNNKPPALGQLNGKGGIGLKNTEKRLQLLFPGKHLLKIESTDNTFSVKINIPLQDEISSNLNKNEQWKADWNYEGKDISIIQLNSLV